MINNQKNQLEKYFMRHNGRLIHKWAHYFDIYDRHFNKFKNKKITVVEFGVSHGGSLELWRKYFGKRARIIGIDINPECKKFEDRNTKILIGDQEDRKFLKNLAKTIGRIDILIDDGGHTTGQQIATFEILYDNVSTGGVYLVEDLHTNYWQEYITLKSNPKTFIEKSKLLIDQLNSWYSRDKKVLKVDKFTKTTRSMHFYDSVIVFEKDDVTQPYHLKRGKESLTEHTPVPASKQYIKPWTGSDS